MVANLTGTDWLRALRTDADPRTVLVCFPPGGGSATAYRALAQRFGAGIAVYAVQYPGRQDRMAEQQIPDLGELAAQAVQDLLRWPADTAIAIFGHSMGATVAFEAARRWEAAGRTLDHLFVSGRPAPDFVEPGRLHLESDGALIDQLELLGNDPALIQMLRDEPGFAELILPAVRNDYQAVETYRHRAGDRLRAPITALISTSDPTTTVAQVGEWAAHTVGSFDVATFEGGHTYLDMPENTSAVADLVTARLRASR
ncbi:alpha/beta fold hydrolase [Nocardia sp. SYP-A9097]|uniref:thioesterase II family protein n=1 Tax=Nocardia sp. SYP-A9097 TaxID=2663237 RepID=UPI001320D1FD|nr:alpha/beta fold hydrolase [Nocardia sp. SYP-A9097]MRH92595.1 alpha/beta fold hydrolase [Nocardia sp. SYP-A9097]